MSQPSFRLSSQTVGQASASHLIPDNAFTTEEKTELTFPYFEAVDGSVASGIWECPPCDLMIDHYPVNETMTILSGQLRITGPDGSEESFGPGDVLFVSKGASFRWTITAHLKKAYMTAT